MDGPTPTAARRDLRRCWRLGLARALAWSLLIGGWLALGEAGTRALPLWAGGLLPLALWLAAIGALLGLLQRRPVPATVLRSGLLLAAAALAAAWRQPPGAAPVLAAALTSAVLVVAASLGVKALRRARPTRPPAPLVPAALGALLAWGATTHGPAATLLAAVVAAVLLAVLLPRRAAPVPACRAGLFDCALPLAQVHGWRQPADWPRQAALLAMLPMMATLPAMATWCGRDYGLAPSAAALLHLALMLLPALLARRWLARAGAGAWRLAVALPLLASGPWLWLQPGLGGLMGAAALQAVAWSLAWAGPMLRPQADCVAPPPPPPAAPALGALVGALALLALGAGTAAAGPEALRVAQSLLALLALAGAAGGGLAALASSRLLERHP
jgi:uncharacterized membrane protein (UPF0136 family)